MIKFNNCQIIKYQSQINNQIGKSTILSSMQNNTIRVRVKTNKFIDMLIAIEKDKTVRQLAHRVLHSFHQLAQQHASVPPKRRQLTVSAIKIEGFYISKTEIVQNIIKDNDEIQCIFSKAKPKFPNYPQAYNNTIKKLTLKKDSQSVYLTHNVQPFSNQEKPIVLKSTQVNKILQNIKDNQKSKKQRKKQKRQRKKLQMQQLNSDHENNNNKMCNQNNKQIADDLSKQIINNNQNLSKQNLKVGKVFKPIFTFQEKQSIQRAFNDQNTHNYQNNSKRTIQDNQSKKNTKSEQKKSKQNSFEIPSIKEQKNQDYVNDNESIEVKKQQPINQNSKQQSKKKKNNPNSIFEILSRASQSRQNKIKKKDKKSQKPQLSSSQQKNNFNQNNLNIVKTTNKSEKQLNVCSKVASPKVTFHSSPMASPQRKISNPSIEKLQLEGGSFDLTNPKSHKKDQKTQKPNPDKIIEQAVQVKKEVKKENTSLNTSSKVIVQQDSDQQSCQASTKAKEKQQQQNQRNKGNQGSTSEKLAALNAKISKYKLQFFNDSSDQE